MLTPTSGFLRIPLLESHYKKDPDWVSIAPKLDALSAREEVILKDTWNKFVAWSSVGMEAFVAKIYQEDPSLEERLLLLGDEIETIFFRLFDRCIRTLQPHTEHLGREAAKPVSLAHELIGQTLEDYAGWFAAVGLLPRHWDTIRRVWVWVLSQSPILEDLEKQEFAKGESSAFFRFFSLHVMPPMLTSIQTYLDVLSPLSVKRFSHRWEQFRQDIPNLADLWQLAWVALSDRWADWQTRYASGFFIELVAVLDEMFVHLHESDHVLALLQTWGQTFRQKQIPSCVYASLLRPLLQQIETVLGMDSTASASWKLVLQRAWTILGLASRFEERLLQKARQWLDVMRKECEWTEETYAARYQEIVEQVRQTDTYTHTYQELAHGAKVAWRNTAKCIGRIHWDNLMVRDCRHVTEPDAMFQEVLEHLRVATSEGNIQIVMTVFAPKHPKERWGPRFWNTQLIRYAAYQQEDGSIIGDPINLRYTQKLQSLGWHPPAPQGEFDWLPVTIETPNQEPRMYQLPAKSVLQVSLEHPTYPDFANLGLRWCVVPAICNIGLDLGGIRYTCTPFNGWFMGTEIARDLFDPHRYNKAETIARWLGLDMSSEQTLWRDRAFLELNYAILYSFQKQQVSLVDHHTASRQFLVHDRREKQAGRECPARWSWIVPPLSGSVCEVFHHEMREFVLEPQYRDMATRWEVEDADCANLTDTQEPQNTRSRVLILFGSESGTAENFAMQAARRLHLLRPEVKVLDDCAPSDLRDVDLLLVITSTFGHGELPHNARKFAAWLEQQSDDFLEGTHFGVMGIGSSIYENFCAGGIYLNQLLKAKGGHCLLPLHKGDELKGQVRRFQTWMDRISRVYQVGNRGVLHRDKIPIRWLDHPPSYVPVSTTGTWVRVQANDELIKGRKSLHHSTRRLVFDLRGQNMPYQTGDHIGIYPSYPVAMIESLCSCMNIDPNAWFTTDADKVPFALPTTPRQVLSEELDLSLQYDCQPILQALCQAATDETEQQQLDALLTQQLKQMSQPTDQATSAWCGLTGQYAHLLELLQSYPSARLTFSQWLALLPRQKPRYYSIATSPRLSPEQVQITVRVLSILRDTGEIRPGLCSHFLARQQVGESIRAFVRTSTFRPPQHPADPLFLVGPGTGISPLVGFLHERQAILEASPASMSASEEISRSSRVLGPAWLFFGCRNSRDFLYQPSLQQWLKTGVLSRLDVAFSRQSKQKVYVQHLMSQFCRDVWAYLCDPRCHIYVCGATRMSEDVFDTLLSIAIKEGHLSREAAQAFFAQMKDESRYLCDVWG